MTRDIPINEIEGEAGGGGEKRSWDMSFGEEGGHPVDRLRGLRRDRVDERLREGCAAPCGGRGSFMRSITFFIMTLIYVILNFYFFTIHHHLFVLTIRGKIWFNIVFLCKIIQFFFFCYSSYSFN